MRIYFEFLIKIILLKIKVLLFFINYLITILFMKRTKNSYKKSGVNIKTADKFTKYIAQYSKRPLEKGKQILPK